MTMAVSINGRIYTEIYPSSLLEPIDPIGPLLTPLDSPWPHLTVLANPICSRYCSTFVAWKKNNEEWGSYLPLQWLATTLQDREETPAISTPSASCSRRSPGWTRRLPPLPSRTTQITSAQPWLQKESLLVPYHVVCLWRQQSAPHLQILDQFPSFLQNFNEKQKKTYRKLL